VVDAGIVRVGMEEELGRTVVVGGPQERAACAHPVPTLQAQLGLPRHAVRGREPFIVPAVVVALHDAASGGETLADVGAAVGDVAQTPQGFEPERRVLLEDERPHREAP